MDNGNISMLYLQVVALPQSGHKKVIKKSKEKTRIFSMVIELDDLKVRNKPSLSYVYLKFTFNNML